MNTIKFFWNGIKTNKGKLQSCHYSIGNYTEESGIPEDTITIYKSRRDGALRFNKEISKFFNVKNDSDPQCDYFETDSIRVYSNHTLYSEVKKALEKRQAHYAR